MVRALAAALAATALGTMGLGGPALASNQIYDFSRLLDEPHPFANAGAGMAAAPGSGLAPVAPAPPTYRYAPPPATAMQASARRGGVDDSLFGDDFDAIFRRVYLAGTAGAHLVDDIDSTAPTGVGFSAEYDTGLAATAAIGRYFGQSFRGELEFSWRQVESDDVVSFGASTGLDSELKTTALMANVFYDVRFGAPIVPYLGLGLGAAFIESDDLDDGFGNVAEGKDSTEFAWQVIAGIAWDLGRFAITADYRYFGTGDDDVNSQTFLAGLRLSL